MSAYANQAAGRRPTPAALTRRPKSDAARTPTRPGGSRDAIVDAAERLFLARGFGAVSMDELAAAAGVARRTLYNQFASKEEIFREMLGRAAVELEHAFPPGIETQGAVEDVLRLIARAIVALHARPGYLGFLRLVVADGRQFPWIAKSFAAVMGPFRERLVRYLAHLSDIGILECPDPTVAAQQFTGMINESFLWPWLMGNARGAPPTDAAVEATVEMFLRYYRSAKPKPKRR